MNQPAPTISHHRANVNGIRLHYLRAGEGDPLVLLHGFPETSHAWRKVMPALARHFTVIAPDLRGCGDSDRPSDGYDKQTVAADIYALTQGLGFDAINLVGHDVGMSTAYTYAATYREQVKQLVLMEAAIPGLGLERFYDAVAHPNTWFAQFFDAPNGIAEAFIAGKERQFIDEFMLPQTYDPTTIDTETLDLYARKIAQPGALRGGIEYFRTHRIDGPRNQEHAKRKLAMPVMSIGGGASIGGGLEGQIRPLVENLIPVLIEDCGHYQAEEAPEAVIDHLLRFFGRA